MIWSSSASLSGRPWARARTARSNVCVVHRQCEDEHGCRAHGLADEVDGLAGRAIATDDRDVGRPPDRGAQRRPRGVRVDDREAVLP